MTVPLVEELRLHWPPAIPPVTTGYVPIPLDGLTLLDACELPSRGKGRVAVGIAAGGADGLVLVPLVATGRRWRRARPGDGLSAGLLDALAGHRDPGGRFLLRPLAGAPTRPRADDAPAPERAIGVDQTNVSVVVGDTAIVKWLQRPVPGGQRAATLLAHLGAIGYEGVPRPYGSFSWVAADGREATIALADAYLPDARDGWDWCVTRLEAHLGHDDGACPPDCDPWIGEPLGRLVAGLHVALATPSDVIPEPTAHATPEEVHAWRATATTTLDEAIAVQKTERGGELGTLASPIRNVLATLATDTGTPIQPIHGDLHVGQVLEWRGGLAIIDFDGNPTLGEGSNSLRQPAARDVAQMTTSLDHVGRVVAERVDGALVPRVGSWIAETTASFLAAYVAGLDEAGRPELFDASLLAPFEVEQECRELVYAARFLPRWHYAPMAALRARFRGR
jgi:maltokinase